MDIVHFKILPVESSYTCISPMFLLPQEKDPRELFWWNTVQLPQWFFFNRLNRVNSLRFCGIFKLWKQENLHKVQVRRVQRLGHECRVVFCEINANEQRIINRRIVKVQNRVSDWIIKSFFFCYWYLFEYQLWVKVYINYFVYQID